jgi:F0F1-type ATP synthase beta subunit
MATWNSSVKANREGAAEVNMEATSPNLGEVVSVRGSVVDVRFGTRLPPIYTLLRAGKDGEIAIEVLRRAHRRGCEGTFSTLAMGVSCALPCIWRPRCAARHWRVPYAIRRLGMFAEQEAQNVASALCDQKITGQRGVAVAKLLVGTTDLPGQSWLYFHLDDAAK